MPKVAGKKYPYTKAGRAAAAAAKKEEKEKVILCGILMEEAWKRITPGPILRLLSTQRLQSWVLWIMVMLQTLTLVGIGWLVYRS